MWGQNARTIQEQTYHVTVTLSHTALAFRLVHRQRTAVCEQVHLRNSTAGMLEFGRVCEIHPLVECSAEISR